MSEQRPNLSGAACRRCGVVPPVKMAGFGVCSDCAAVNETIRHRAWYERTREQRRAWQRAYYRRHRDRILAQQRVRKAAA